MKRTWMTVSLMLASTSALAHPGHELHGLMDEVLHLLGNFGYALAALVAIMGLVVVLHRTR